MGKPLLDWDKMTNEEILKLFKEQYEKIKPNDAMDYHKKCGMPSLYILKKRLGLSWNQALIKIGIKKENFKFDRNRNYKKMFNDAVDKIGYVPSVQELRNYCKENKLVDITCGITKKYKSYANFLNKLGLELENERKSPCTVNETNEELLKMYKDFCIKLGRVATIKDLNESDEIYNASIFSIRFGGFNNLRKIAGYEEYERVKKKYTKYSLLQALKEEYIKKGSSLNQEELLIVCENNEKLSSISTLLFYFKTTSYDKIWEEVEKEMLKDYIKLLKKNKSK